MLSGLFIGLTPLPDRMLDPIGEQRGFVHMEVMLFIAAVWVILALLARWRTGKERSTRQGKQSPPANVPDKILRKKRAIQASPLEDRREGVLCALREGRLNSAQITQVLQAASLYKFFPEEVAELRNALPHARVHPNSGGAQPCRVCGKTSMPGEDLCYSHQAK